MSAVTHNIQEMAVPLKQSLGIDFPAFKATAATAMIPPKPIVKNPESSRLPQMNWPHHSIVEEDLLQTKEEEEDVNAKEVVQEKNELDIQSDPNEHLFPEEKAGEKQSQPLEELDGQDNWGIDDLVLPEESSKPTGKTPAPVSKEMDFLVALPDKLIETVKQSSRIGDLIACGLFGQAMTALKKQIGVYRFEPLKPIFLEVYMASSVLLSSLPLTSPLELRLLDEKREESPLSIITMNMVENELKAAYKLTTEGAFNDAIVRFRKILLLIPMLNLQKTSEKEDVGRLIRICLEYIVGLRCEVARKQTNVGLFILFL